MNTIIEQARYFLLQSTVGRTSSSSNFIIALSSTHNHWDPAASDQLSSAIFGSSLERRPVMGCLPSKPQHSGSGSSRTKASRSGGHHRRHRSRSDHSNDRHGHQRRHHASSRTHRHQRGRPSSRGHRDDERGQNGPQPARSSSRTSDATTYYSTRVAPHDQQGPRGPELQQMTQTTATDSISSDFYQAIPGGFHGSSSEASSDEPSDTDTLTSSERSSLQSSDSEIHHDDTDTDPAHPTGHIRWAPGAAQGRHVHNEERWSTHGQISSMLALQ